MPRHAVAQRGLSKRQAVTALEKEATVLTLFFGGECNQSLIQVAAQYYVPATRAGFRTASLFATETAVANRYGSSQAIPGSLLLITINPHSLRLTHPETGPAQGSIDQSLLLRFSLT
jgi:hypothetical protein